MVPSYTKEGFLIHYALCRGLAQTSPFEVSDAPQGQPRVRRSAPGSSPDRAPWEITDSTERSVRQPAKLGGLPKG
jgi:hypothetical protein